MELTELLKDLSQDDTDLKYSSLLELSDLSTEETREFRTAWGSVSSDRKRDVLGKMVELSEDNLELEFKAVYAASLRDPDEDVRLKATQGLWECEDRAIVRPLLRLASDDTSPRVRAAAAVALGGFARIAQDGKLLSRDADRIHEGLLAAITRVPEELEVRRRAIEAIACLDFPDVDRIIQAAYDSGDGELKQSALYAMGQSSNTDWLEPVMQDTMHEDPAIRFEAANAGGLLGDESIAPNIVQLLGDEDSQVQIAAVQALGKIGGTLAKKALDLCLESDDEALQEAAGEALADVDFEADPLGFRMSV